MWLSPECPIVGAHMPSKEGPAVTAADLGHVAGCIIRIYSYFYFYKHNTPQLSRCAFVKQILHHPFQSLEAL